MNRSMPGLPVHHHLPEFTQTHVHRVREAIQPSNYCSSRECDFSLWKNNRFFESVGATLDRDAAKDFLTKGRHRYRNLVSKKTGNTFTADIVMEVPKTGYVRFKVEFPERRQKEN